SRFVSPFLHRRGWFRHGLFGGCRRQQLIPWQLRIQGQFLHDDCLDVLNRHGFFGNVYQWNALTPRETDLPAVSLLHRPTLMTLVLVLDEQRSPLEQTGDVNVESVRIVRLDWHLAGTRKIERIAL